MPEMHLRQPGFAYKKQLYSLFLWMGFNCLKAIEPPRGGSLLFTTKLPEISRTHFIDLRKINKAESTLEPPSGPKHGIPGLEIQRFNH